MNPMKTRRGGITSVALFALMVVIFAGIGCAPKKIENEPRPANAVPDGHAPPPPGTVGR
jgi:hypothetical protein